MWHKPGAALAAIGVVLVVLSACGRDEAPTITSGSPAATGAGQAVYETRCAPCHGVEGRGDGPAAAGVTPRPRNFRDPDFWNGRSSEQLLLVVRDGKPGTLMPPFEGALDKEQIDAVVAYIQTFRPGTP